MPATWASDWNVGDVVTKAEFRKSMGCVSDTTLSIATASITLSSIPTTYAHLMVEIYARGDTAAVVVALSMRFNGDTAANYDSQVSSFAAAYSATASNAATSLQAGFVTAATARATRFAPVRIAIPNYGNATNFKGFSSVGAFHDDTNQGIFMSGGSWRAVAALTSITLFPSTGNFLAGTRASAYVMGS